AGQLNADVVYVDAKNDADLERFKGKLKGMIVLTAPMREVKAHFDALGTRMDATALLSLADSPAPTGAPRRRSTPEQREALRFTARKYQFFHNEGAALLVDPSRAGDGGTIFVQGATV